MERCGPTTEENTNCTALWWPGLGNAYPRTDDYETPSDFVDGKFVPGTLKNSAKFRAAREFAEEFGGYYLQGAENLSREEFLKRFGNHLPPYAEKILSPEPGEGPGNFNLKLQIHMNFS